MAYKEYRRPSIDLDAIPKKWELREASEVNEGAIISDFGKVITKKVSNENDRDIVTFINSRDVNVIYYADTPVFSFQ